MTETIIAVGLGGFISGTLCAMLAWVISNQNEKRRQMNLQNVKELCRRKPIYHQQYDNIYPFPMAGDGKKQI